MPTRGKRKEAADRTRHEASDISAEQRSDSDDSIEILEVVGVNETEKVEDEPPPSSSERPEPEDGPDPENLFRNLREALLEKNRYRDLLLRKQAEFENYRKRSERDGQQAHGAATAAILARLLPVLDNLERALRSSEGSTDPLRRGVSLVHQQFLVALTQMGLVAIEALGARFDPCLHEAVEMQDAEGFEKGVILEEIQKGYLLHDRLLRPALVKVASGERPGSDTSETGGGDHE
jgi:molecular chaperone GrpE